MEFMRTTLILSDPPGDPILISEELTPMHLLIPPLSIGSSWQNPFSVMDGIFAVSTPTANIEEQFMEPTCQEFLSQRIFKIMLMSKNGNMLGNHDSESILIKI